MPRRSRTGETANPRAVLSAIDPSLEMMRFAELKRLNIFKHHATMRAACRTGRFPAPIRDGNRYLFLASEVRVWLQRRLAERQCVRDRQDRAESELAAGQESTRT